MRVRHHWLVYLFYLAVTLVITFPLITVIGTRMIGHPLGDAYEYTHHIWWIKTALQTGQNPFFEPNIVYPDGASATLLWSEPLQSFPAWLFAFVLTLPAAFNLAALLTLALNGWAMFFLVRSLTRAFFPALIAGLVFMIYPAFQGQLGAAHTGLLTLYPAPIYFFVLLRLRDATRVRRTILAGALLFMVSLWGSILLLIYLIAPITALYLLMRIAARDWRTVRRALITVILGALFAAPFVVPLAIDTLHAPPEQGSVRYSASLLGVVSPSFYHPLFSGLGYNREVLGVDPFEQASYVGVIAAALALIGVWRVRGTRWWLLLALIAWVFSLGPLLKVGDSPLEIRVNGYATYVSLPWALFQNLPLIGIARTPARFNFAVGFAVAIMAGYGVSAVTKAAALSDRKLLKGLICVVLMLGIGFEYQFWWALPTIPGIVPAPIAALAARSDIRAVLDIPWYDPLVNKEGMFLQTGTRHAMIVGQIARRSPVNPAKVALLQDTLDPALLDAAGVDVVILHKVNGGEAAVGAFTRAKLGAPFYEDEQYAAFDVPKYHGDPPGFMTDAEGDSLYFYAPQGGSAALSGQVDAESGAALALDNVKITDVSGTLDVAIQFAAGYHAISIGSDPPCPTNDDPALVCPAAKVKGLALQDYRATGGDS